MHSVGIEKINKMYRRKILRLNRKTNIKYFLRIQKFCAIFEAVF